MHPGFRIIAVFAFCLLQAGAFAQNRIVGTWFCDDGKEKGYFRFDTAGYAFAIINGDTLGGPSFIINGVKAQMKFEADTTVTPNAIDLVVFDAVQQVVAGRLPGIFRLMGTDKLKVCFNFEGRSRPKQFDKEESGNTIILKRVDH